MFGLRGLVVFASFVGLQGDARRELQALLVPQISGSLGLRDLTGCRLFGACSLQEVG